MPGDGPGGIDHQGYLWKLKENKKEWKKIYVTLQNCDIIYYSSPSDVRSGRKMKDGVKTIISAIASPFHDGLSPDTATPHYMTIETTHAKKVRRILPGWRAERSSVAASPRARPPHAL